MTSRLAGGLGAGVIASLLVQATYGFSFTAYDPYTADTLTEIVEVGRLPHRPWWRPATRDDRAIVRQAIADVGLADRAVHAASALVRDTNPPPGVIVILAGVASRSAAGVALMGQAKGVYTFFSHLKWSWAVALGYAAGVWAHILINNVH